MQIRIAAVVLAITGSLGAEFVKQAVTFRLQKNPRELIRGWVTSVNTDGFRYERFGGGRKLLVPWSALTREDARRLRVQFEVEWIKDVEIEYVMGHRIHFQAGKPLEGLLVRKDKKLRHWIKISGVVLPYPGDQVARVEEAELPETTIYNNEEIYLRRLQRRPPNSASEHRDLADYMFDLGNWTNAIPHYENAAKSQPLWKNEIDARVAEIRDILKDQRASKEFSRAKYWAALQGDFARGKRIVEEYIGKHPEAKRRGFKVLDQIEEIRQRKLGQRFQVVKHQSVDRLIHDYLRTKQPDNATARAWLDNELAGAVSERVRKRLGITEDEYAEFAKARARGAPHFATYWSGTFIVNTRTKKGAKPNGAPESWWTTYKNSSTRATWMKAYAAERNPELFEVVQVRFHDCERCGGRGFVRMLDLNPRGSNPMEWNKRCPRCLGAQRDRAVAYR